MAWYSTGTVTVTTGSTVVTGTGTSFINNARYGDALLGPDGKWYEVISILSDTALSISPNYLGTSVSLQGYKIVPVQGYTKVSADLLRTITNDLTDRLGVLDNLDAEELSYLDGVTSSIQTQLATKAIANISTVNVQDIAALRNVDGTKYKFATTAGYYTSGDGGHAEYWYDAADTTTADNGFTVIVGADGGRWKLKPFSSRFNVKQAGAKGDGTADDAPFIQIALAVTSAVKAPLVFPAGDYRLLTYVTFPSNSTLIGEEGAQIYLDPTMTLGTAIGGTARAVYASAVSNISLSGIRFYGTKTGLTKAVTVCLNAVTKLTIDKCTFENMGDVTYYCQGLIIYNSTDVKVTRSKFYNNSGDGLAFSNNVSNYHVSENEFSLNVDWGFALVDGCNNGTVSDNYILNNTGTGTGVDRCSHVTFTGNVIKSNEHGIRVAEFAVSAEKNSHITITGNTIRNSQVAGVSIEMMASAYGQYAIVGNTIEGSSNQGIRVSDAEVGTIVGNTIYSCAGDGVLFTAATAGRVTGSAAITGNKIHTCLNGIRQLAGAGATAPITVGVNDIGPVSAAPIVQINAATSPHMTTVTSVAALRLLRANGTVHAASLGYYTAGDGGHGEYWYDATDTTTADNGFTTIVGDDGGRWKLKLSGNRFNVRQAGAKGDGVTDDTSKFQTVAATGVNFSAGSGTFLVSGSINLAANGQQFTGDGTEATALLVSGSGYDVVILSGHYTGVSQIRFYAATHRSSGAYVALPNPTRGNYISHFFMQNGFRGISITAESVITDISIGEILDSTPSTGVSIYVGGGNDTFISQVVTDNNPAAQPLAGLQIKSSQAVWATNCDFIHSGRGLLINPDGGVGNLATWCFFNGCGFDSSSGAGIEIKPTNTGHVRGMFFDNCWSSTCNIGVYIDHDGTCLVSGIFLNDSTFYNNKFQGVLVGRGTAIDISDCRVSGNSGDTLGVTAGIEFAANITNFSIKGCRSGAHANFPASQSWGVLIGTGCDDYLITDNMLLGNATGAGADTSETTSVNKIRNNNIGWVNEAVVSSGVSTILSGTNFITVNHGLSGTPVTVVATPSNVNLGAASPWWTGSYTSTTFNINTAANVASDSPFTWEAKK